jgi:DNA (cytosine-5)-methyltransferase 1
MENVPQVHSQDNIEDFKKWIMRLEELGYSNYWQDLIATDYGIPQTRNRCFMVSILGDYSYSFPPKQELKLKLKDMLENNVPEKYYLSDKLIKCFMSDVKMGDITRKDRFLQNINRQNQDIANSITTLNGQRATDTFITNKSLKETLEENEIKETCFIDTYNKRIDKEKAGTITTGVSFRNNTFLAIKNATKKGYLEATEGDGIDISPRMKYHRGTVQKGKSQTLTTAGGVHLGVIVK